MSQGVAVRPTVPAEPLGRFLRCARAQSLSAACQGLVEDLYERWELPSIYLLIDGRLRCQAARGYFQVVDGFALGCGVIGRVVETGEAEFIADVRRDPGFIGAVPGLLAEACVPVLVHGRVVGAINVESMTSLPPDALDELVAAAGQLGATIERLGGMPAVPLSQRLARIVVGLTSLTDSADVRGRAVDGAREVSGMTSAALSQIDPHGTWTVTAAAGPLAATLSEWTDADHRIMAAWVDAGSSSHFPGGVDVPSGYEFLLGAGVRAISVQPLVVAGRVTGLLTTADARPVPHDSAVGAAVELLAAQIAASLANAEAMAELSRRAEEDPLTGLRNAASFVTELHATAAGTACLLIDIDHFKQVNDTFGHVAGDRLLCALADELRAQLRDSARVYRVGGDELAVLLVAEASATPAVAQRLVEAARRVRTTVSIGVAYVGDGSPELARLRADEALYQAKSEGRDRFVLAPQS